MKTIQIRDSAIVVDKIVGWEAVNELRAYILHIFVIGSEDPFSYFFHDFDDREIVIDKLRGFIKEI
jgi:hypothetical protein